MNTCPETLVNDELRPPVISMHPSERPIAIAQDQRNKLSGTGFFVHWSFAKSKQRISQGWLLSPKKKHLLTGLTLALKNLKDCLFENYTALCLILPTPSNIQFAVYRCSPTLQCLNQWNGESYALFTVSSSFSSLSSLCSAWGAVPRRAASLPSILCRLVALRSMFL